MFLHLAGSVHVSGKVEVLKDTPPLRFDKSRFRVFDFHAFPCRFAWDPDQAEVEEEFPV